MSVGPNTTASLNQSLNDMVASIRLVREMPSGMAALCEPRRLGEGVGLDWTETDYARLTAQNVTETTELDNPQQVDDNTQINIRPTDSGIHMFWTTRALHRMVQQGASVIEQGTLAINAIRRKQDVDGLTAGQAATTDMGVAGNPLTSNLVFSAMARVEGNATEQNVDSPLHLVHHRFPLKDIHDEIVSGVGTYDIGTGLTAQQFKQRFPAAMGTIGGAAVHTNGNFTIDASDDTEGFLFAGGMGGALILVEDRALRIHRKFNEARGGGGWDLYVYLGYAFGERAAGLWLYSLTADATAPA
jgi:hypothetical protein